VSEQLIQKTLTELHTSRTILIIAHRLSTIAHADQIIVLEEGEIKECGSLRDLINNGGYFSMIWQQQIGSSANSVPDKQRDTT
jgi:ABC-type multidrug transport system fused ATPase/permease subunit